MSNLTATSSPRSRASQIPNYGKPAAKSSPLALIGQTWTRIGRWGRTAVIAGVVVSCLGGAAICYQMKSIEPVSLMATRLQPGDVREISRVLMENGIDAHVNASEDGITVAPKDRQRASALVIRHRLPRHSAALPGGPEWGQTSREAKLRRQLQLQGDIENTLRQFGSVMDADVKLAIPEGEALFKDSPPVTAAVALHLKQDQEMPVDQISAIVNFVAASVPELQPDHVNVVDAGTGRNLSELCKSQSRKAMVGSLWQMEASYADHLRKQAQEQLDAVLGSGKARLTVTCRFDFSEEEIKSHSLGLASAVLIGAQIKDESMKSDDGEKSKNYDNKAQAQKFDHPFTDSHIVHRDPRLERVNASVIFNNLPAHQVANLTRTVEASLGMDPSRGDRLEVANVPFQQPTLVENPPTREATRASLTPIESSWAGYLAVIGSGLLVTILVFLKSGSRGAIVKNEEALCGKTTFSDLADLRFEKTGRGTRTEVATATCDSADLMEKMARTEPKQLAARLRESWLHAS